MKIGLSMCACRARTASRLLAVMSLAAAILSGHPSTARAHGGQLEVGGGARGPVTLTKQQQEAIGLQTVVVDFRTIDQILAVNGEVRLLPERQADVSLRISGRVKELYAGLGDRVRRDQRLAKVESRVSGDPPPSIVVTAPIDGTIDARNVILGQAVEPNTALFRIGDHSRVIVAGQVYEEDLGKIRPGMAARVQALSYPRQTFTGKIVLIEPVLDPVTRTVKTWIEVANPEGLLKPNMLTRASIVLQRNESSLAIPRDALLQANGESFVFVREGGRFRRVEITTGAFDDEAIEVTSELVPGDEVVTQGNRELYTMWLTGGRMKEEE